MSMVAIGKFQIANRYIVALLAIVDWAACNNSGGILAVGLALIPKNADAINMNVKPSIAQIKNCNIPASDVPMILPIIN